MPAPFTTPVALSVPFEPNRNPGYGGVASDIESVNVQDAIEEAKLDALSNDRFILLSTYNGNANTGRHLEFFSGIASNLIPINLFAETKLLTVVFSSSANSTATLGFFDLNISSVTPVYTISLAAQNAVTDLANPAAPNAIFSSNARLAIRITAGSVNRPAVYFFLSAST